MRVLLLNPDNAAQSGYSNPPLGLAYLAGSLEKHGVGVRIVDGYLEGRKGIKKAVVEYQPDIVGITCYTPGRNIVLDIARWVKSHVKDTLVVLGGPHPTIMWKQIMNTYPFVDICVLGEGEQTLLEIALGFLLPEIQGIVWRSGNVIRRNRPRVYAGDLDQIPFPAWHLLPMDRYPAHGDGVFNGVDLARAPRVSVIFSRGCTGHCTFCSTWWIWRKYRQRSPQNMVD